MWRNFSLTVIILCLSGGIIYTAIFNLDPLGEQALAAYLALFCGLFFMSLSFFTLFFFFAAELFSGYKLGNRSFLIATRRALLLTLFFLALLGLQFLRLLGIEEAILLAVFFGLTEWIFLTGKYY